MRRWKSGRSHRPWEVRGVVPVIQTESATITTGLPRQVYTEKPIFRPGYTEFAFDNIGWVPGSASGNVDGTMMGNRAASTQTSVEGMQMWWIFSRQPSTAVDELNVIMSNAPAEYARPVTIDATYRGGNNRLTGEWREDFKNPCTHARNTPFSRIDPQSYTCLTKWWHFVSAGGPIFIPKVYDGRNKTFFFSLQRDQVVADDIPLFAVTDRDRIWPKRDRSVRILP